MKQRSIQFNINELMVLEDSLRMATYSQYDMYKRALKEEISPKSKKEEKEYLVVSSLDAMRQFAKTQDLLDKIIEAENELREI